MGRMNSGAKRLQVWDTKGPFKCLHRRRVRETEESGGTEKNPSCYRRKYKFLLDTTPTLGFHAQKLVACPSVLSGAWLVSLCPDQQNLKISSLAPASTSFCALNLLRLVKEARLWGRATANLPPKALQTLVPSSAIKTSCKSLSFFFWAAGWKPIAFYVVRRAREELSSSVTSHLCS